MGVVVDVVVVVAVVFVVIVFVIVVGVCLLLYVDRNGWYSFNCSVRVPSVVECCCCVRVVFRSFFHPLQDGVINLVLWGRSVVAKVVCSCVECVCQ